MDQKLEVVPVPVTDIDSSKEFYEKLGFNADTDIEPAEGARVVQLTPPGSACSIVLGKGLPAFDGEPGSIRSLHLVVDDIDKAREAAAGNGVEIDEVLEMPGGMKYAGFSDPDGNTWTYQQWPA